MFCQERFRMTVKKNPLTNKAKILDAASALFLEGGVSALSVRAIAAKAGVSTIGIYSHFQGKDGLLEALYIEGFALVSEAVKIDDFDDPHGSAMIACERYLDIAENNQAHYQLIFGEAGAEYVPSDAARSASIEAFGCLLSFTSTLLPEHADIEMKHKKALEVWAILHGFVCLKRHSVGQLIPAINWRETIMDSIEKLIS